MGVAAAEFAERRFAENHRAGFVQLFRDEGVTIGKVIFEQQRAQGRRHAFDIGLIFHDHRNAVQRTDGAGGLVRRVETVGFFERVGIDRDDAR